MSAFDPSSAGFIARIKADPAFAEQFRAVLREADPDYREAEELRAENELLRKALNRVHLAITPKSETLSAAELLEAAAAVEDLYRWNDAEVPPLVAKLRRMAEGQGG